MKQLNFLLMLVFTLSFTVMHAQTKTACCSSAKSTATCSKAKTNKTAVKTAALDGKACDMSKCEGKPCPPKCCKGATKMAATNVNAKLVAEKGKISEGKTCSKPCSSTAVKSQSTAQMVNNKTVAKDGKACCNGLPCPIKCCKGEKAKTAKNVKLAKAEIE